MSGAPAAAGPLAGLRVLDLTRLLPGGYCTLLLADLGADVVKIEEPGRGDYLRWTPPLVEGASAAHRALNRGKRSVTLNLKAPEGRDLLGRLVDGADVLVEGFRPGVMARLGAGHEVMGARNPALIWCAITGYGQDGPYRDLVGHDVNYVGYAGALSLGEPGAPPGLPGVQVGDLGGGGMLAAVGILAALLDRRSSGRGRFVDVSMLDGVVSWLSIHLGAHLADPDVAATSRPLSGSLACYRLYRTADGRHLTVGALEPPFWRALCETLGCPDLIDDQYAAPNRQREMAARLQAVFETRTRDEWLDSFRGVPACVGPVNDLSETRRDPQVQARAMLASVAGAEVGPGPVPKLRGLDGEPEPIGALRPAPDLGEHTGEILAEVGVDAEQLGALHAVGAV